MTLIEKYGQIFNDFCVGLKQIEILCAVATYTLDDFPNNLPENLRRSLVTAITEISEQLNHDKTKPEPQIVDVEVALNSKLEKQLVQSVLEFIMMKSNKKVKKITDPNFGRVICSQSLIIVFAHLEAFMTDTIKFICDACPEVLKSKNKKISFEDALKFESNIKQLLIDRYTYEFGWKSIDEKLAFFKSEFGLKLEIVDSNIDVLKEAENVRHIIVHNGGRISQQFIDKSKNKRFKIGGFVTFSFREIIAISQITHYLASKMYVETIKKFAKGYENSNLDGVFLQYRDLIEELRKD
jgi:hypothetical protein